MIRTKMTGKQLRGIRQKFGMTQEQLASELEMERSMIAKWETGVAIISRSRAKLIRLVLKGKKVAGAIP